MKYEEINLKTLIYDKKQLEQMLKDLNYYLSEHFGKDYLAPYNIDFINKQFPELPEEGLLVSEGGSLVYKLSDGSGYGFEGILQSGYYFNKLWDFSQTDYWKPATPEQEKKFIEMMKKECEKHGLFEDTKIENHADRISPCPNSYGFMPAGDITQIWNKNGMIFHKGNFAKPLKESTLDLVTDAVKNIANFTIEESPTGLIILTPINK